MKNRKRQPRRRRQPKAPPRDPQAAFHRRVLRGAKAVLAGTTDTYTESDAIRAALSTDASKK